jgi:MFS family permease
MSDRATVPHVTFYPWYVAGLLSLAHLVSMLDRFVMGIVMIPIRKELALTDSELGLLFGTAFALFFVVVGLPLGRVADRRNRRNLIAIGLFLWSLATAASAFANSFRALFAARMAVGIGEACLAPAAMSLIAAYFPRHLLARATAVFTMGAPLGRATAFLGGGAILSALVVTGGLDLPILGHFRPWQVVFIAAASPGILLAALVLTIREPRRPITSNPADLRSSGVRGALAHIRAHLGAYVTHVGTFTVLAAMQWALTAWAASLYVRELGLSVAQAGAIVGIGGLIAPLGHLLGGYAMDRLTAAKVGGPPIVTMGLALVGSIGPAILFCCADEIVPAALGYLLLQLIISCAGPPGYAGVQLLTPDRYRGVTTSIFVALFTFASVGGGPLLVGFVSDQGGAASGLGRALLISLLSLAAAGLVLAWWGRGRYAAVARTTVA